MCYQGTASEATLVALLAAKAKTLNRLKAIDPDIDENEAIGKLRAYSSGIATDDGKYFNMAIIYRVFMSRPISFISGESWYFGWCTTSSSSYRRII